MLKRTLPLLLIGLLLPVGPALGRGGGPFCVGSGDIDSGPSGTFDGKSSPGLNCIPSGYTSVNFANQYSYGHRGDICNESPQRRLKVRCPVIRDQISSVPSDAAPPDFEITLPCIRVHFWSDIANVERIECAFYARSRYGAFFDFTVDNTPTLNVVGTSIHSVLEGHLNIIPHRGYYYISCNIQERTTYGAKHCLRSYLWYENKHTD